MQVTEEVREFMVSLHPLAFRLDNHEGFEVSLSLLFLLKLSALHLSQVLLVGLPYAFLPLSFDPLSLQSLSFLPSSLRPFLFQSLLRHRA